MAVLFLAQIPPARGATKGPLRIGALTLAKETPPFVDGLREGLKALGVAEGKDFTIEEAFAKGDPEALGPAAKRLIENGVDLIFAMGELPTAAAKAATNRVPIVFTFVGDPVGAGLVRTIGWPGGNATGVSDLQPELGGKRLEILRELVPSLRRVGMVYGAADRSSVLSARSIRAAAKGMGIQFLERPVRGEEEAKRAFRDLRERKVDGLIAPDRSPFDVIGLTLDMATGAKIPAIFSGAAWVEEGALIAYGSGYEGQGRQAARLVAKVMRGAWPADIPVEFPAVLELAVNLKTAKAQGVTVPSTILFRADKVIR